MQISAVLVVSQSAYDEIRQGLIAAGYEQALVKCVPEVMGEIDVPGADDLLDMRGIALARNPVNVLQEE